MALKKTVNQEDLRKLMKQKTESERKKIDHPLAKYNSLDQLLCNVCLTTIKSETLWNTHILSRSHREKVSSLQDNLKHPSVEIQMPPLEKKAKLEEKPKPKSILKNPLQHSEISKSANQSIINNPNSKIYEKRLSLTDNLDEDFSSSDGEDNLKDGVVCEVQNETLDKNDSEVLEVITKTLPEGFFDDPKLDAKVRNVVYKDKMEEEMEVFQKEIKEQSMMSETIVIEEEDQREDEKIIEEIDDQMSRWSRIEHLANKKKPIKFTKKLQKFDDNDLNLDSDEDDNLNCDDIWRIKATSNKIIKK